MLTNRWRMTLAGLTVALMAFSLVLVTTGPPAGASHIPATGPLPANCVEFQVNTLGTESPAAFPDVDITVNSWDDGSESHQLSFSISGLAVGQYVDISVKSGTEVQEDGPYGNGTHSFSNGLQNAISHIRLCVFGQVTTTTVAETTTTVADTTTTVADTTTTVADTTTTVADTTTTIEDEVLGTVITTTTIADVAGTTIVAGELPFTGYDGERLGQLALILLVLGVLTLAVGKSVHAWSRDEG